MKNWNWVDDGDLLREQCKLLERQNRLLEQQIEHLSEIAISVMALEISGRPPAGEPCPTCGRPMSGPTFTPSPDASQHSVDTQAPTT